MKDRGIYPDDFAEMNKSRAGDSYRPSSGTEGDYFAFAWCRECKKNVEKGCRIFFDSLCADIDEPQYPKEFVYGADGQPTCTAFEEKNMTEQYSARPDDAEPITDQWFREKWPEEHELETYAIECDCGWLEVHLSGAECRSWALAGSSWDGSRFITRGDVRRFLWYLESPLIP